MMRPAEGALLSGSEQSVRERERERVIHGLLVQAKVVV